MKGKETLTTETPKSNSWREKILNKFGTIFVKEKKRNETEFNFKKPFGLEDVEKLKQELLKLRESKSEESKIIDMEGLYKYLIIGSFLKKEPEKQEALKKEGEEAYNDLLLSMYNDWKEK